MTDIEVSTLIKQMMNDIKIALDELVKTDEFVYLETRYDELKDLCEKYAGNVDLVEKYEIEIQEIEEQLDKLVEKTIKSKFQNISQSQMQEILSKISPSFIEKNHIPIQTSSFRDDYFSIVIAYILDSIDDNDFVVRNNLLLEDNFVSSFDYREVNPILYYLVKNTNNEANILKTLDKIDWNDSIIEEIIDSKNFSLVFKKNLLINQEFLQKVGEFQLTRILQKINLSSEEKLALVLNENISSKLSDYYFSSVLGSMCKTYNDIRNLLNNALIKDKIVINEDILENLSSSEINKVFEDKEVLEKLINSLDYMLAKLIRDGKMDYNTRCEILFNDKIFTRLDRNDIDEILLSTKINGEQRLELMLDSRIYPKINEKTIEKFADCRLGIPTSDILLIINSEKFVDCFNTKSIFRILSERELSSEECDNIIFNKKYFYKAINEWNKEYNNPSSENKKEYNTFFTENVIEKNTYKYDKYEYFKKLHKRNPYITKTFYYKLLNDELLDFGIDFIEKMSLYPDTAESLTSLAERGNLKYLKHMVNVIENSKYAEKIDISFFINDLIDLNSSYILFDLQNPYFKNEREKYYNEHPDEMNIYFYGYTRDFINADNFTEEQWENFTEIKMRSMSIYYKGFNKYHQKILINDSLNILPDVNTNNDLNNYTEKRLKLCDDIFKSSVERKNLDSAKNAYLNKYFSINIEEAREIVRLFGSSIHKFDGNSSYDMQTKYVEQIEKILNITKIDTINQSYNDSGLEPLKFDEVIYIDQSIRQMFSKNMSDSVYKVTDKVMDEKGNIITNKPKIMNFVIDNDGEKSIKQVQVYEPGYNFKMLIHSTAAYGEMELLNDNYFDSWNKNFSRKSNHGICCSLISNDNMGMAEVKDVLFGFDSWNESSITKSAPYDIYSENNKFDIKENRPITFMSAQDIINNTRHTHNEHVLERRELRDDKRNLEYPNIQPSYVIIYSDMRDEIKQKAVKCSEEMNIPIVYLDKEKIVKHEVEKIDSKIEQMHSTSDIKEKMDLLEQILLSHENNRSGLRMTNNDWLEEYFPTGKVDNLFKEIITEVQSNYSQSGNINEYYFNSSKIMDILDNENKKFEATMESVDRKNYIDIPVENYKTNIMQFINQNLCRTNIPKIETIIEEIKNSNNDLLFTQVVSQVDTSLIHKEVEDIIKKRLYPNEGKNHNIGHIERVIVLSRIIGEKELTLENGEIDEHSIDLLTECAKYHDSGRESDKVDLEHGKKSAKKLGELINEGYSEEDIKVMKVAVEYHEEEDSRDRFEKICQKYGLDSSKIDYARKIANCLKDADALDRVRFKNTKAKLDEEKLRTESSKKLVTFAEELNKSYEDFDKKQFRNSCEYLVMNQNRKIQEQLQDENIGRSFI